MTEIDLHNTSWYIRVENEEQFNVVNEWLKENFGDCGQVGYDKKGNLKAYDFGYR